MDNFSDILTPVLTFVVGVIGPALVYVVNNRQAKTDRVIRDNELKLAEVTATQAATDSIINTLQEEVARLQAENGQLRVDVDRYRDEITDFRIGSARNIGQLESLGHQPLWRPPGSRPLSVDDYLPKRDDEP